MKGKMAVFSVMILLTAGLSLITDISGSEFVPIHETNENFEQSVSFSEVKNTNGFFTENKGQWDEELFFVGDTSFGKIGFGKGCVYYNMRETIETDEPLPDFDRSQDLMLDRMIDPMIEQDEIPTKVEVKGYIVKYTFEGANEVIPVGSGEKNHKNNYFIGSDPDKWVRGARNLETVVYKNLYDKIDLKYYFSQDGAKYDLILKPYANPDDIRIKVEGHESLEIEDNNINIELSNGRTIQDRELFSYHTDNMMVVPSSFKMIEESTYGFEMEGGNIGKTTIIDPLIYSTYIGGSSYDYDEPYYYRELFDVDSKGNAIMAGLSDSSDFPITPGAYDNEINGYDYVVFKLNNDGSDLVFSTFIGGTGTNERPYFLRNDEMDNIIVVGHTDSNNFPTTANAYRSGSDIEGDCDLTIIKLKSDGSDLLSSTLFGSSGDDKILYTAYYGIHLKEKNGNLVMGLTAGSSNSDFPTTPGAFDRTWNYSDVIVFEMRSDGSDLVFSTYVGGNRSEYLSGMEVAESGDIYLTGSTRSEDFPTSSNAINDSRIGFDDIFFMKLKGDGSGYHYSTYIGGSKNDGVSSLWVDETGSPYITGRTGSSDFPNTIGHGSTLSNQYILKMKSDLSGLEYSTILNGSKNQSATLDFAVDQDGQAIILYLVDSPVFPTTPGAFDSTFNGYYDMMLVKISADGSRVLGSTFFGGDGTEEGCNLIIGYGGEIYVGGTTNSTNLPMTYDSEYPDHSNWRDAFYIQMNDMLTELVYSTYFGGNLTEYGSLCRSSDTGDLYLRGVTDSGDFITSPGAYDDTFNGGWADYFLIKLEEGSVGEPVEVYSLNWYSDEDCQIMKESFDIGDRVFFELVGKDSDMNRSNIAGVLINFSYSALNMLRVRLRETGKDTGVYRRSFIVPPGTIYGDTITVCSKIDPAKKCYLFIEPPFRPISVNFLEVYSDPACTISVDKLDKGDTGYVKVVGVDSDPSFSNKALANLTSDWNKSFKIPFVLDETGPNTGIYIGSINIPLNRYYFENFTVSSVRNEAVTDNFMIHTPVLLRSSFDVAVAKEDEECRFAFWNFGYSDTTWNVDKPLWLNWDEEKHELFGTPDNSHVGAWDVLVRIHDDSNNYDENEFNIAVENTPPEIITDNVQTAVEGEEYYVDYNCSDDGQGEITWTTYGGGGWLTLNRETGELRGTPTQDDVGVKTVYVTVTDDHGGMNTTIFNLTVHDVNNLPRIINVDITTGTEGELYYRKYEGYDPDQDTDLTWGVNTNASFLTMDKDEGILTGTPGIRDTGYFFVNISLTDSNNGTANRNFTLTIENVNSRPQWVDVPEDIELIHGQRFFFDVNATDLDPGEIVEYSITSAPDSDISIDQNSGEIEWMASIQWFEREPYILGVNIKASDGELFAIHNFDITITSSGTPKSELVSPEDGSRVPSKGAVLKWSGSDPENEEITYDIFVHQQFPFVEGFMENALFISDFEGELLTYVDIEEGNTYYWSVRPYDGCTYGPCTSVVRSFRVNHAPVFRDIVEQKATAGKQFQLKVSASDKDMEDSSQLLFILEKSPNGMTITPSGIIEWKPTSDQEGYHTITVAVNDSVETITATFTIEALQGEEAGFPIASIAGIGAAIVIIAIVIIMFFVFRKKNGEKEEQIDEEEARIKKEFELHQQEVEWEKQFMKPHDPENELSSVPLSASEAHAHDKDNRYDKPGYEDLYGQPAPEMEEGDVTAEDLRDSFREAAEELEQMEHPEE